MVSLQVTDPCPECESTERVYLWQPYASGRHLRCECTCGRWIRYLKQTPENVALVEGEDELAPEVSVEAVVERSDVVLSDAQSAVVDGVCDLERGQVLVCVGYAGVGKSTTLRTILHRTRVAAVLTPTGKASSRLAELGVPARTIHSLLYSPREERQKREVEWDLKDPDVFPGDLVIVDEASMVGPRISDDLADLLATKQLRIALFGDGFQLPPILSRREQRDYPAGFSLLGDHGGHLVEGAQRFALTEVFRQALDSPVLAAATSIRNGGTANSPEDQDAHTSEQGGVEEVAQALAAALADETDVVGITWTNRDRHAVNRRVRSLLGRWGALPVSGEPLMVLHNQHALGLMNGETAIVQEVYEHTLAPLRLDDDDGPKGVEARLLTPRGYPLDVTLAVDFLGGTDRWYPAELYRRDFGLPRYVKAGLLVADWGYASTAHKAQGSESDHAIVYVSTALARCLDPEERRRLVYTAITRARSRLHVVYGEGLGWCFGPTVQPQEPIPCPTPI